MPLCIWKNPHAENLQVFLIGVESKKTTIDLRIDVHGFFLRVAFLLPKRGRLAFMVGHKLCQPKNASRIRKWRRTYPASKRISYAYINMHIYIYAYHVQVVNFIFLFPVEVGNSSNSMLMKFKSLCTLENLEDVDVCSWLRFFSSETHQSTVGFWMLEVQS